MDRRAFLTTLLGGTAAALLLPQLDAIAVALPTAEQNALDALGWQATFRAVHREAWRLLDARITELGIPLRMSKGRPNRLGDEAFGGVVFRHALGVAAQMDGLERAAEPAMMALAQEIAYRGIDTYGRWDVPKGMEYGEFVGPLRMCVFWSVLDAQMAVRFDVLGGSSPEGQRYARRRQQDELKTQIRRRLKRPAFVAPIPG